MKRTRSKRGGAVARGCAIASMVAAIGACGTASAAAPDAGALGDQVLAPYRDVVIQHSPRSVRQASASAARYSTGDGHSVAITVDPNAFLLEDHDQIASNFALFLGTRLHGDEIDRLSVFVTDSTGITARCGPDAYACYYSDAEEIDAEPPSDQQPAPDQPNSKFVITHEYGHHIANNRRNTPWSGIDWGPKRWDTYERVCPGVRSGRYHPGDEGNYYDENPGEAWAESFAFRQYPNQIPWNIWDPKLQPDQGAFDAIWRDVKKPWTGNVHRSWSRRFDRGDPANKFHGFTTPLDGSARITLTMPDAADYDLRILATHSGKILATGVNDGPTREVAYYKVCGRRSFRVQVHRYIGFGRFHVRVSSP
jgi:hypothetical protein